MWDEILSRALADIGNIGGPDQKLGLVAFKIVWDTAENLKSFPGPPSLLGPRLLLQNTLCSGSFAVLPR